VAHAKRSRGHSRQPGGQTGVVGFLTADSDPTRLSRKSGCRRQCLRVWKSAYLSDPKADGNHTAGGFVPVRRGYAAVDTRGIES